jgi:hypothetical protein
LDYALYIQRKIKENIILSMNECFLFCFNGDGIIGLGGS